MWQQGQQRHKTKDSKRLPAELRRLVPWGMASYAGVRTRWYKILSYATKIGKILVKPEDEEVRETMNGKQLISKVTG